MEKDGKSYFALKKLISTSKQHVEHPFAVQNTQQMLKSGLFHYSLISVKSLQRAS